MQDSELISVIIPVYKSEKYINKCIDSILNQTYKNLEILLIDDGSPDSSGKICDEYAKKDSRIKVIHKKNEGVSTARNIGIEKATGDYITFVDSDDWIELDTYNNMLNKIKEQNVDIIRCGYYKDFESYVKKSEFIFTESTKIDLNLKRNEILDLYTSGKIIAGICYLLIKRNCCKNLFNKNISLGEDFLFELELICTANSIFFYNERFYHYYTNNESATKSIDNKKRNIKNLIILFFEVCDLLEKYNVLTQKQKEDYAFYCFYSLYNQLARYVKYARKDDLIHYLVTDENMKKLMSNLNIKHLKPIPKIFYCLIIKKQIKMIYYLCLAMAYIKYRNE